MADKKILYVQTSGVDTPKRLYSPFVLGMTAKAMDIDATIYFLALGMSLIAIRIARRPSTSTKTYGYHRVEIMAALANGVILILVSVYMFYEAYQRFSNPPTVNTPLMILLAANRERASHELYLGLARIHPAGEVKRLLEELALQELEHKQQVEFLYAEVAFPQTDGG